jgi:hypothetical protein
MLGPAWVSLLRRVPADMHGTLAFVLTTGAEVVVQSIVRLEHDFIIVRGRMAGSMDTGRVVVVPLDQINFLAFNKKMTEVEAHAFLAKALPLPGEAAAAGAEAAPADGNDGNLLPIAPPTAAASPLEEAAAEAAEGEAAAAASGEAAPAKPGQISKSVLLARLRARLKEGAARPPGER